MAKEFEDGDGEVEVRLNLPLDIRQESNVASNLIVQCTPNSLKVLRRNPAVSPPLLDAHPLYEKIRPDETTWYLDSNQLIITLQKAAANRKWPALTDSEALEKRFGPLNLSSSNKAPIKEPKPLSQPKDGAGAMAARDKVDAFLRAAQRGDLENMKSAAIDLAGSDSVSATIVETKDATGRGALHFAAHKGKLEVIKYLLEEVKYPVDLKDEGGETALMLASREGHLEAVKKLLEHGADPKAVAEPGGAGAIHHAAAHGSVDLVKLLAVSGADVDAHSDVGPPLLWACGHGNADVVLTLLDLGAHADVSSEDGVTSLVTAAAAQHTDIVRILLEHGADPNRTAGAGVTALFIAANEGNSDMVDLLLKAGADPNATDDEGARPINAAAAQGHVGIVTRLLPITTPHPEVKEWTVEALLQFAEHPLSLHKSELPLPEVVVGEGDGAGAAMDVPRSDPEQNAKKKAAAAEAKERADALFKSKDFLAAVDAYTQAFDLDSSNATVLSNRSLCWMRLGQPENALEDAIIARKISPTWAKACYRQGSALRLLERYEEAATAFYEGVQLDPDNRELALAFQEAIEAGRAAHKALNPSQSQ